MQYHTEHLEYLVSYFKWFIINIECEWKLLFNSNHIVSSIFYFTIHDLICEYDYQIDVNPIDMLSFITYQINIHQSFDSFRNEIFIQNDFILEDIRDFIEIQNILFGISLWNESFYLFVSIVMFMIIELS